MNTVTTNNDLATYIVRHADDNVVIGQRLASYISRAPELEEDLAVGNLSLDQRTGFFRSIESMLTDGDGFLLGVDLVKDETRLVAAYNDSAGISSAFNKNVLTVLNRELDGDLALDAFDHETRLVTASGCMEQSLRANRDIDARLKAIDLDIHMDKGESIHTEWSCKFTRPQVTQELAFAGLDVCDWWTDSAGQFALALARRTSSPAA